MRLTTIITILVCGLFILPTAAEATVTSPKTEVHAWEEVENTIEPTLENVTDTTLKGSHELSSEDTDKRLMSTNHSIQNETTSSPAIPRTQPAESAIVRKQVLSDCRSSYIVDFGFEQYFVYSAEKNFGCGFSLYVTAYFGVVLSIPVNVTMEYSDEVEAGKPSAVNVTLYDAGPASFSVPFGITVGGTYRKGIFGKVTPFELFNESYSYDLASFPIPLDPTPLADVGFGIPIGLIPVIGPVISQLFGISLRLIPQLDVDINADVFFDGDGEMGAEKVSFLTFQSKRLQILTGQFSKAASGVMFGLTNFTMSFNFTLLWRLAVELKSALGWLAKFIGINNPLTWDMFTYPRITLPFGLTSPDTAWGSVDVLASSDAPSFDVDSHSISGDTNGNTVVEPGEDASLTAYLANWGPGSAVNANVTASSSNITVESVSRPLGVQIGVGNTETDTMSISVPGGYSGRNATITYHVSWLSPNGTIHTDDIDLLICVLQPGMALMSLADYGFDEPIDGYWDAGESVNLTLDFVKVGTEDVDYVGVEIWGVSEADFSSMNAFEELVASPIASWTSSDLELTAPITLTARHVEILLLVGYEVNTVMYYDYLVIDFEIRPQTPCEELDAIYASEVIGDADGVFEAGETLAVAADLLNAGNNVSTGAFGILYSDDSDVIVSDELLVWDGHDIMTVQASTNAILLEISPFALNRTITLTLYLYYETWYGEGIYDEFLVTIDVVQQASPVLSLNSYDVLDFETLNPTELAPGAIVFIVVEIGIEEGPGYAAVGKISTDNEEINILNDTASYGNVAAGDSSIGDGFVVAIPNNFAGGNVEFTVNVTLFSAVGEESFQLGYFIEYIAPGDISPPAFYAMWDISGLPGDVVTVTINSYDENGIAAVFLTVYDYATDDWLLYELDFFNASAAEASFYMPDDDLLFAFWLFDNAGNWSGAGIEEPLVIELDTATTTTTTTPTSSTTDPVVTTTTTPMETTSTSTTSDEDEEDTDFSLIAILALLSSAGIGMVRLRRKERTHR